MKLGKLPLLLVFLLLDRATLAAEQPVAQSIILASTTSVENSGLLAHILPADRPLGHRRRAAANEAPDAVVASRARARPAESSPSSSRRRTGARQRQQTHRVRQLDRVLHLLRGG